MPALTQSLMAWNTDGFSSTLKRELEALGPKHLPLGQGTSQGGYIGEENISVSANRFMESNDMIEGSVAVFFTEIVINCGCGDEPMPTNAYCELQLSINKNTATASFAVITD